MPSPSVIELKSDFARKYNLETNKTFLPDKKKCASINPVVEISKKVQYAKPIELPTQEKSSSIYV